MSRSRQLRWWAGCALVTMIGLAAGGWPLAASWRAARAATRGCARLERQTRRIKAVPPAQARAVEAELAAARVALAGLMAQLGPKDRPAAPAGAPATRTEAFFLLTSGLRRMREALQRAGVDVRPDEQFGFSAYANEGPPAELQPAIARQLRLAGGLIDALAAAHPRQLAAMQRTRPIGAPAASRGEPTGAGDADRLALDSRLSVAERDLIATDAFRLVFVGATPALRSFLNGLAASDLPVLVRNVTVEPVAGPSSKRAAPGDPLILVARPGVSQFTVTVETFEVMAPAALPPVAPEPPPSPPSWPAPPAQHRGHAWIYELFEPPSLYVDPQTGVLSAGLALDGGAAADARFDLELVQVRRGRFRWQLAGYAAGADGLRGIFADLDTGATVVAGAGDSLGESAWTVRSLRLDRPDAGPDGATTSAGAATATLADNADGEPVTLTSREPCETGAPQGLFTSRRSPEFRRLLKEGESIALSGANYCVERLALQPPQAVVARLAPGEGEPLILALTPRPDRPPAAAANGAPTAHSP
jgi:hypothetical protein